MPLPPAFAARVAAELPPDVLSTDPSDLAEYGRDWTRIYTPAPSAVALPRSTEEVARLVRLCAEHDVPIVPSGGRTGLAGGAVATRGELVLSTARMRRMDPVDTLGSTVRVQAGAVTEAVHAHCAEVGLWWPVDFASKGSSTVGGNIGTNAGGVKVIRWGHTRNWVLGLQVVTAAGEVLELGGALEKNNTGVDLRQLFIGSEGTLGIVTEATLKLAPVPPRADVLLFSVEGLPGVLALFRHARRAGLVLNAYEFFTEVCLRRVLAHRKARRPFEAPATHYVLVEVESGGAFSGEPPPRLAAWVEEVLGAGLALDGVIAQSPKQAADLWTLREGISESLGATGLPHKNDIALPVARLEAFCADLDRLIAERYPEFEVALFGHIGDGNLHVNVMKPDALDKAAFHARTAELDHAMFALVRAHAGSISAEHGIGLVKKPYLAYTRSPGEIGLMRALKRALDPRNLLNPGKILDAEPAD